MEIASTVINFPKKTNRQMLIKKTIFSPTQTTHLGCKAHLGTSLKKIKELCLS